MFFKTNDRILYSAVLLSKPTFRTKVKFEWKAIRTESPGPGTIAITEHTTKLGERFAHSHVALKQDWPIGEYTVTAYLNGVLAQTISYSVFESAMTASLIGNRQ
jgi:hypothetical protein